MGRYFHPHCIDAMLPAARTITVFDALPEAGRQTLLKAVQDNHTEMRGSKRPRHRGPNVVPILPLSQAELPTNAVPPPDDTPVVRRAADDGAAPPPVQDGDAAMSPASPIIVEPPGLGSGGSLSLAVSYTHLTLPTTPYV